MQRPMTLPSTMLRAANRVVVPSACSHGSSLPARPFFDRQPGLGAVERLDLALLIDREHDRVRRRIDVEPRRLAAAWDELRVLRQLERRTRCGCHAPARSLHRGHSDADGLGHHAGGPVGRLRPADLGRQGDDPLDDLGNRPARPGGRVLSRSRPSTPSRMNRSCQRPHHRLAAAGAALDGVGAQPVLRSTK